MAKQLPLVAAVLLTCAVCADSLPPCPPCGSTAVPYPLSTAAICGDPSYEIRCSSGTLLFDSSNNTYLITSISAATQRLIVAPSPFLPNTCVAADLPSNGLQLNSSAPFNITDNNTIFYLNCSKTILNSSLNCTSNSLCQVYSNGTSSVGECSGVPCCTFRAGRSTTSYGIRVRQSRCRAYRSFVNLDYSLPVSRWPPPGVELQWELPPEPICRSQGDCESDSTCKRDPNSNNGVNRCFCKSGLQWNPVVGVCANECARPDGCGKEKDRTAFIAGLSVGVPLAALFAFFLYKRHSRLVEEEQSITHVRVEIVNAGDGNSAQDLEIVNAGDGDSAQDLHRETNTRKNLASRLMDSKAAKVVLSLKQKLTLFVPLRMRHSPPPVPESGAAQPAAAAVPDLPRNFTISPPPDIESGRAQPAAAAQLPNPPPQNSTFSGVLVTLCFTSAVEFVLQNERRFPVSFNLFSLAIACAFAATFLRQIIHFRPNGRFAFLLETMGKGFFAAAFFLAAVIPSPLWVQIVDVIILIFGLAVVIKYGRSSDV